MEWIKRLSGEPYGEPRARDFTYYLVDNGKVHAYVFWLGGHVERPDEWVIKVLEAPYHGLSKTQPYTGLSAASLTMALAEAEEIAKSYEHRNKASRDRSP